MTNSDASDNGEWESRRQYGRQCLWEKKYVEAIDSFTYCLPFDHSGESHAGLGLAHFQREEYSQSRDAYQQALNCNPADLDWQAMLSKARGNAISAVQLPVPPLAFFDKAALLRPAGAIPDRLPAIPTPRPVRWLERFRRRVGTRLGTVATFTVNLATTLNGTLTGYKDRVWTNWYQRSLTRGILTLAYMRERLNQHNLKSTYPAGELVGFEAKGQTPPPGVTHYRTADGSWNNFADPKEGAAGTRFLRNVNLNSIAEQDLLTPNPREISRKLLTRKQPFQEVPFLNLLAATWIQFENHDWINHGETLEKDPYLIPLDSDDPARRNYSQEQLSLGRTQPDPTYGQTHEAAPITFINEVTHWWDGSQIYGSDYAVQRRLRSLVDGKMRLNADGTLPLDDAGLEQTGFNRNWWLGLTIMHTLFVREHNAICDRLKTAYPQWNDDRLFNVARLVNAAVMAKIHTVEWTPAILPNPGLNAALNANWFGILTNLFEYGKDRQTLSEIKLANPELGGVVGNPIDKHGVPYGLSEEFTEVYRLHSLLPESLRLRSADGDLEVPVPETRQAASAEWTRKVGVANLIHSFGVQHPGALVLNNFPQFMQEMSVAGNPLLDLGATDIIRARERRVPRYNEFRRQLGLNPIASFDDLTDDKDQVSKIKEVYGNDVEKLDLMIGTLAEGHRPTSFGFGETMFQIFILNATRRLQADRFFTDCYNEDTYTREGLEWIDSSSFKTVLLRNFPELAKTGLANVSNAFEPWDSDRTLDQKRHPLRAYDEDLKPNPWLGDAYR